MLCGSRNWSSCEFCLSSPLYFLTAFRFLLSLRSWLCFPAIWKTNCRRQVRKFLSLILCETLTSQRLNNRFEINTILGVIDLDSSTIAGNFQSKAPRNCLLPALHQGTHLCPCHYPTWWHLHDNQLCLSHHSFHFTSKSFTQVRHITLSPISCSLCSTRSSPCLFSASSACCLLDLLLSFCHISPCHFCIYLSPPLLCPSGGKIPNKSVIILNSYRSTTNRHEVLPPAMRVILEENGRVPSSNTSKK